MYGDLPWNGRRAPSSSPFLLPPPPSPLPVFGRVSVGTCLPFGTNLHVNDGSTASASLCRLSCCCQGPPLLHLRVSGLRGPSPTSLAPQRPSRVPSKCSSQRKAHIFGPTIDHRPAGVDPPCGAPCVRAPEVPFSRTSWRRARRRLGCWTSGPPNLRRRPRPSARLLPAMSSSRSLVA